MESSLRSPGPGSEARTGTHRVDSSQSRRLAGTRYSLALPALALVFAQALAAQATPLGPRTGRSSEPFELILGALELPDGRVLVSDGRARELRVVDFTRRTTAMVGRQGDGPKEYRNVSSIFRLPSDSILVFDGFARRTLMLSPTGEIIRATPIPPELIGRSFPAPRGVDRRGVLYLLEQGWDPAHKFKTAQGTIFAWQPGTKTKTAVATIATQRADQVSPKPVKPFPFHDAWAVRRDGVIARVVADGYEVVWLRNGREIGRSGTLPHTPIRITAVERSAFTDSIRVTPSGGRGGASATVPQSWIDENLGDFPEFKPPILPNHYAAIFDTADNLWISRESARGAPVRVVDVVSESKGLIGSFTLPANSHLIALGARGIYVVTLDDDGQEWLDRLPLPQLPAGRP